jgi:hypothetical protein
MKTAHAIFGAVVAAFGVAAFVTFYDEFKPRTKTPPRPNAAAQTADSLTPANSIAHDFAVLDTTPASSSAQGFSDVPKSVQAVPSRAQTPPRPNAAAQTADSLTPANSIAHDFAVLDTTPASSSAQELSDVPKSVQTVPVGPGSTLLPVLPTPAQAVGPTPAPPAARAADHRAVPETLPSHADPVDVCARNGGHRVNFMRGHHAMWKCVYQTSRQ